MCSVVMCIKCEADINYQFSRKLHRSAKFTSTLPLLNTYTPYPWKTLVFPLTQLAQFNLRQSLFLFTWSDMAANT
jgi:hypothetical protein